MEAELKRHEKLSVRSAQMLRDSIAKADEQRKKRDESGGEPGAIKVYVKTVEALAANLQDYQK